MAQPYGSLTARLQTFLTSAGGVAGVGTLPISISDYYLSSLRSDSGNSDNRTTNHHEHK